MKSAGMQAVLREYAGRVQSNAGEGFGTDCAVLSTRAVATVFPETKEAAKEAYTDNALLKALR